MTGEIKVWSGSAFIAKPVKVWNGSAWNVKPAKVWNGSAWIATGAGVGGPSIPVLSSSQGIFPGGANSLASLVSTAITVANGDLLVVKTTTWDNGCVIGAATAPGHTLVAQASYAVTSSCPAKIWSTTVAGNPGTLVVTQPFSGNSGQRSMVCERWTNAKLAATPAINATKNSTGVGFSTTVTSVANNSLVTWAAADWNGKIGTPAYRSSATEENHYWISSYGAYYATQSATTAGAQTFGMTSPSASTVWTYLAMEVQGL